ncbi:MAG: hypothetical protein LBD85_03000 [Oscillospiraceae bacterium]|jgi:hypothetical protein|nr:hypothetical protein [Oscillospiraceae bacterium]
MVREMPYTTEKFTEIWRGKDGREALSVSIEYPALTLHSTPARKINAYYARRNRQFTEICKKILPRRTADISGLPVKAILTTQITYIDAKRVSLLNAVDFNGAARARICADLWSLESGTPLPYTALFPETRNPKGHILKLVRSEIRRQSERGFHTFYPGALKRMRSAFAARNIFLNSGGEAVILFPRGTIAPDVCEFVVKQSPEPPE